MAELMSDHPHRAYRDTRPKWTLIGMAIGGFVSLILLLALPFALGFCFFLIGSEADPVGPVLFACCLVAAVLPPVIGGLAGILLHRIAAASS
jgi:hypothetical protein